MQDLNASLTQFHSVEDTLLDAYLSLWKPYPLAKKQSMRAAGEVKHHLYYVLRGVQNFLSSTINSEKASTERSGSFRKACWREGQT